MKPLIPFPTLSKASEVGILGGISYSTETNINLTRGDFEQKFFETFTFEPDPMEELEDILEEIKIKFPYISFPEKGYSISKKGIRYGFDYLKREETSRIQIKIKCECSNELVVELTIDDIKP